MPRTLKLCCLTRKRSTRNLRFVAISEMNNKPSLGDLGLSAEIENFHFLCRESISTGGVGVCDKLINLDQLRRVYIIRSRWQDWQFWIRRLNLPNSMVQ
jgi:hypothetical protein